VLEWLSSHYEMPHILHQCRCNNRLQVISGSISLINLFDPVLCGESPLVLLLGKMSSPAGSALSPSPLSCEKRLGMPLSSIGCLFPSGKTAPHPRERPPPLFSHETWGGGEGPHPPWQGYFPTNGCHWRVYPEGGAGEVLQLITQEVRIWTVAPPISPISNKYRFGGQQSICPGNG
jgi:hypothetical protein